MIAPLPRSGEAGSSHPHHLRHAAGTPHLVFHCNVATAVRCCTAGGVTPFHVHFIASSEIAPVIHDGLFFRYMLHGGDGIRAVVVLTDTQRNRRWRDVAASAHTLYSATPVGARLHFHLLATPSVTRLTPHADRTPLPVNQAYQHHAKWQRDFTVEASASGSGCCQRARRCRIPA